MLRPLVIVRALMLRVTGAWGDQAFDGCDQSKDLDRKIRGCTQIIRRGNKETKLYRAATYNMRGIAYGRKGYHARAVADFSKAIALKPDFSAAYYNRAEVYRDEGDFDSALADLGRAIEISPKLPRAYYKRAIAYKWIGDNDLALSDFDRALEFVRKDVLFVHTIRGNILTLLGDLEGAIAEFDKVIMRLPDKPGVAITYRDRGHAYSIKGKIEKARADFAKAKELNPWLVIPDLPAAN